MERRRVRRLTAFFNKSNYHRI